MELNREYTRERSISIDGVQSSGDYTLPDYQGDVRKILYTSASLQDGGKFHNGDALDCIGTVTYKIVYSDADGRVTPVCFSSDYEFSIKCPGEEYVDSDVHARVANFSLRLMGPRRFSARCTVEASVSVSERAEYRIEGDVGGSELECRSEAVRVATGSFYRSGEREIAEELVHLEGAIQDEVEVVLYSAEPTALSASRTDDGISVKGQILARALVASGGEMPRMYESAVEISEVVAADNIDEAATLIPKVNILSESVSTNPCEDGVSVVVSIIAEAAVSAHGNSPVTLLKDCFCTERRAALTEGEFIYTEHIGSRLISEKFSASVKREEIGAENVRNVLCECARVKIEGARPAGESVEIVGSVQVSGIACEIAEDGTPGYIPVRFESPFAINANFNCQIPENARYDLEISLETPHLDVDENEVRINGNLVGSVSCFGERRAACISAISLGDEGYERDSTTVSVYYPTASESLFDVAKKFHVSPMSIARDNELTETVCASIDSSLYSSGIGYLLIK